MEKDVRVYVAGCLACLHQSTRREVEQSQPTLLPLTVVMVWMLDLIHMPMGTNGKRYLIHMVDRLSGYLEAMVFKHKAMLPMMKWVVENVFYQLGFCMVLIVDGGEFSSHEAQEISAILGFTIYVTSPHNHQALGEVERVHSPLVKAIAKVCCGFPA
ncbi:hypothetical protein HDU80_000627, partial [Chytriomyces hyalinus]